MRVPRHVAIIMDGNGRWAERRGLPRTAGHRAGVKPVRTVVEECARRGVAALTLFAFSSENFKRPVTEVGLLMQLFLEALDREIDELAAQGIAVRFIGARERLGAPLVERMVAAEERTRGNPGLRLAIAVAYGGKLGALGHRRRRAASRARRRRRRTRAGGDRRAALRRRARARRPARARSLHPQRRRPAHQQLPALEPRLHRALVHRDAVAGFRRRAARARLRRFRRARAPLRHGARAAGGGRMLRSRVATALALLALLLAVLFWLPVAAGIGFFALVVLLGAWEWAAFAGLTRPLARLLYVLATAALGAAAWAAGAGWLAWMHGAALWWLLALLWLALRPHAVNRPAAAVAGLAVLVPAWLGLARLLEVGAPERGAALLLYMLLVVWATDIGAYFAGRRFGRVKLAPEVSPNKTWEGVLGGTLFGLVVAVAGAAWFHAPLVPFTGLGLAIVGSSMIGDLTESMFKRFAHLKDSGSLLPGHGGVLDRIDSITSAVPFYVLGLSWLGLLE